MSTHRVMRTCVRGHLTRGLPSTKPEAARPERVTGAQAGRRRSRHDPPGAGEGKPSPGTGHRAAQVRSYAHSMPSADAPVATHRIFRAVDGAAEVIAMRLVCSTHVEDAREAQWRVRPYDGPLPCFLCLRN